jgi:hypothetical protein
MAGDDGTIWSCYQFKGIKQGWVRTTERRRQLKTQPQEGGHLKVTLATARGRQHRYVHTLVLLAFVGPRPAGQQGRHKDGVPTHNWPDNLCWGTRQENSDDRTAHGRVPKGESNGKSKITSSIALAIVSRRRNGEAATAIAASYGVDKQVVYGVTRGRTWSHVTGIPKQSDQTTKLRTI